MEPLEIEDVPSVVPPKRESLCNRLQLTKREWYYSIVICILIILSTVYIVTIVNLSITPFGSTDICETKECVKTAAQIITSMNDSADPCTDFYDFACGGWRVTDRESNDWIRRLVNDYLRRTTELLSRENISTDFEAVKKARILYNDCISVDVLGSLGKTPLQDLLQRAGLPRETPNNDTLKGFDLSRTLARVHKNLGIPLLFDVSRDSDDSFSLWDIPNKTVLNEIITLLKEEAKRRSVDVTHNRTVNDDVKHLIGKMSDFEEKMQALNNRHYQTKLPYDYAQDFISTKMNFMSLHPSDVTYFLYGGDVPNNTANTLHYDVFMETLLEGNKDVNWNIDSGTLHLNPKYHKQLVNALKIISPLKIQLIIWNEVVRQFEVYTPAELRQGNLALNSQLHRSTKCSRLLMSLMPAVVDYLTAQQNSLNDTTEKITAMAREIQKSQMDLVEDAEWIGTRDQQNILQFLDDVTIGRVGYLDWVAKGDGLDDFFKDVVVHKGQLLKTIADIQVWQIHENFLVSPKIGRLRSDSILGGAYYSRQFKTINVKPLFMQFPFFPLGLDALNYGALGVVLGHEFGHALYEAILGNAYSSMEQDATSTVDDVVNCTKNRVEKLSRLLNIVASPNKSITEDIPDISGMRTAFYTYNRTRSGTEPHLPGLKMFNHDQLFFLAFANIWCSDAKPPAKGDNLNVHSENKMRVISAVSNTEEFAKIWNCSANTPMNPEKKCRL